MKYLEAILAFAHLLAAAVAVGQTDQQLIAQVRASAAEAVAPGPPPRDNPPAAPARGEKTAAKFVSATLSAMQQAEAARLGMTEAQYRATHDRLDRIQTQLATNNEKLTQYIAQRTPTPAPVQSSACSKCGPNCRCAPGQCNCRWPGECLGVPDNRVERSVVRSAPATTTTTVWRERSTPVEYYYVPRRTTYYRTYSVGAPTYYSAPTYYTTPTYYYSQPRWQCSGGQCWLTW
jgi:hypothetical protein